MNNGGGTSTSYNWCGIGRKNLVTSAWGSKLVIALESNAKELKKITDGYYCVLDQAAAPLGVYAYFVDNAITSKSSATALPSAPVGACANGNTIYQSCSNGAVYKWDSPGSSFVECAMTGRWPASTGFTTRTMVARKSDMLLAMSVKEGESTARLFHSTDGDTWSSTYITLNLPATIGNGAPYVELQAGEDGYWYGSMYSDSGSGNERLFKFEYEARVGDCP
jgi:hypothetical protein